MSPELLFALIVFVSFEIYKMINEALFLKKLDKMINKEFSEIDRLQAWQIAYDDYSRKHLRIWPFVLITTVVPGFLGGFILIIQFMKMIIKT